MTTPRRRIAALVASAALVIGLAACSTPGSTPEPTASTAKLTGTITVFGAASLTAVFTDLAKQFQVQNPGTTVQTTFNGSAALVTQIQAGAPADVFASADTANMAKLLTDGTVKGVPENFASNVLEIAVPTGNPAGIKTFADLAKPGVKTIVCAAAVPCGAAALTIEGATGVKIKPVSEETAVTGVLAKVQTGEADAGLVYVTDVKGAAGKVLGITFPESSQAVNIYPIASLEKSANPKVAAAFVAFVLSPAGQKVLAAAGFGKP